MCQQMTVVKDALTAMEAGGVHAMHDATEGGVRGGLFEIASASGIGMEIDESLFVYPEEIHFPDDEQSTYTAAAMILAADALDGVTPAADIFLVTPTA